MILGLALAVAGPLAVSAPASVRADGRTPAAIELVGGADALEGEDPARPDHGSLACVGASVLAASGTRPPRVLAPAAAAAGQIFCVARRRGEEITLSLRADPPGPGLYASLVAAQERGQLTLGPFRLQTDGSIAAPRSLHAAVSAGTLRELPDSRLRVALPPGRAPRAIAVALLDDEREGAAFFPLAGGTRLHLESKRHSSLSVRVAGALFGPVRAPEGKATLAVLVPPGERVGVVRAVDRLGNAREVPIDLETPELPRLAAVASAAQVIAGGELRVAIALAAPDGAPAENAAVRAAADRGSLAALAARGAGLWVARYRAPAAPGSDRIAVGVQGDPSAGGLELLIEVVPGPPEQISLELPEAPVRAGEEVVVRAGVRDAAGNALSGVPLEASLAGAPARVSWNGTTASVLGAFPQRLPPGAAVELSVQSGENARAVARIEASPGDASTAELSAEPAQRMARVRALVRDRFGNPLGASGFALSTSGASVGPVRVIASGAAEADLDAAPRARAAEASIVAGGRVLARTRIAFDPPPDAWLLFVRAEGGGMSNGGALHAPRFGAGLGIRSRFGRIEGAALIGLDALWYRDEIAADLGGAQHPVSRHLFALGIPLLLRARLPIARRWGAAVEAGPVPTLAWTSASSDVSGTERLLSLRPGVRAQATIDFSFGRSRIALGASWGSAHLVAGPLRGEIEGRSLFIGYEAWWLDIGPF